MKRLRRPDRANAADDAGFILLEAIISIGIIVIVMAGLTTFFITVTRVTNELRAKQASIMVADGWLDQIRAMQPSDTYAGRTSTSVATEFHNAPAQVSGLLTTMTPVSDNTGSPAKLAMITPPATINGIQFTATNYLGSCSVPVDPSYGTDCDIDYAANVETANFLRVVLAVTWTDSHCPSNTCAYASSTLLSTDTDPNFLLNQAPPAAPIITDPGPQTSAINDQVSLQMVLNANTGVPPITWSTPDQGQTGDLPAGLSISTTGLITGTPTAPVNPTGLPTTAVTAMDAFGRTATMNIIWKILADVVPVGPATWAGTAGSAISNITLTATGGSGAPYTWTAPAIGQAGALPPGLSLSGAGVISGTPSTAGGYGSVITVKDSSGRSRTLSTGWTVYALPSVTMAATAERIPQNWTVANHPVGYSCPTATCTLTLTNAPTGVGLSATATGAGAASLPVTSTSGNVYLVGTVTNAAASFPSVTVTPVDTRFAKTGTADSEAWTVTAPGTAFTTPLTVVRGSPITTQQLAYSCATACTISFTAASTATPSTSLRGNWLALTNVAPTGPTIAEAANSTGTFYLRGTPSAADTAGTYRVALTIVDASGNSITRTATWTVN